MQIVKTANNKIQFLVLGKLILSLNNTASLQITSNEKGILITDITLKKIELFTNDIESTQLLPTAAVPFTGSTQSLFELLDASFFFNVSGGSGEVNDGLNVGAGNGIFKQKSGLDLEFKTLISGSGLNIVNNANDLTISAAIPTILQPPQITTNQNDYTPTGWSAADIIILDISANRDITGFGAVADYKTKTLVNTHITHAIKIKNNDSNSTAANRVLCPDNKDYDLKKTASISMVYLDVLARWQIIGKH